MMETNDDRRDSPQVPLGTAQGGPSTDRAQGRDPAKAPETVSASASPSSWTTDEEDPECREIRRMEALQLADFQDRRRRALQRDRDMEIDMENAARRAGLVPVRHPGTLAPVPPAYSNFGCMEFQDEDMDGELSCAGPPPRLRPAAARAGHGAPVPRVSFP
ncbi:MAG: hypothetical protein LBT40_00475, partial [Deltaproteobacteria bacterium]|nr:hypothetical protein [Deltaproteobacteria bacterium]